MSARLPTFIVVLLALPVLSLTTAASEITGVVRDADTGRPVPLVTVSLLDSTGASRSAATTDSLGAFAFSELPDEPFTVVFSRIGYQSWTLPALVPGTEAAVGLRALLAPSIRALDTIVITASRRQESSLHAPASTTVIDGREIVESASLTPADPVRTVVGVDFASKGLIQHTYAVRGSRSVNSGALLVMTDFRYASVPALDINVPYLLAVAPDDIERIEVARGPSAAIYGPNSDRGVLHIITRSPFESRGTSFSLGMGERETLRARLRHAGTVGDRIAYKISVDRFQGEDWGYVDPQEQEELRRAIKKGVDPDTLKIGVRDHWTNRSTAEARIDWAPANATEVTVTGGMARARAVDLTPTVGAVQADDWLYSYLQLHIKRDRLSANLLHNRSDSGETYALRTGNPVVDESHLTAVQLQHGRDLTAVSLLYGVDARRTQPRTRSTLNGRNENNDTMTEVGAYVSGTGDVNRKLTLVGAMRVDYHDRINDTALSPRVGAVYHPGESHSLRLTYNRAFSSPDAAALFIDTQTGSLGPYDIRVSAVPKDGLTFSEDCGGRPCMQNPWGLPASLPADATLTWAALVQLLAAEGIDLSSVPAPNGSQVGTRLLSLDPERGFVPLRDDALMGVPGPRRVIRNALEAGYKGILGDRVTLSADVHWTHVKDNQGPLHALTPSVFFDQATLEEYLSGFMPPEEAAATAAAAAKIPMGTITPDQLGPSSDILLVNHVVDDYTYAFWGVDLSMEMEISSRLLFGTNYSYLHENVIDGVEVVGDVVLGVPNHKGAVWLRYRDPRSGWRAGLRGRVLEGFPVNNGVYRGRVDGYACLDLDLGFRLSRKPRLELSLDASNVLDNRHREILGAAEMGRLVMVRLDAGF